MLDRASVRRAIARKRDGESLSDELWAAIVAGFLGGVVDDAQMSALCMACVLRGLDERETVALTQAYVASGERLDWGGVEVVDKHSSGGVGDTTSLIVVPLIAACGLPVAKLSGRALGHTGGTLDKLEALAGVRTDLSPERFADIVRGVGCAITAQGARFVPADKRIYALRDHTATVPSVGLIAASIVSKKVAGGARAIVYDVKAGGAAFMPTFGEAAALAERLIEVTRAFGAVSVALVTDMDEPLGPAIGTGLELIEARDFLRGVRQDERLATVARALGAAALVEAGYAGDPRGALARALESGAAAERFAAMLAAQGAAPRALEALAPHPHRTRVRAARGAWVASIDAVSLGERARELTEQRGPTAGIVVRRRVGAAVERGDLLAEVYGGDDSEPGVCTAFTLADEPPASRPLVYCEIGSRLDSL